MLMPLERLRAILELLFREGVLVAEKDRRPQRCHPQLPGVPNLAVLRAMGSLRARGLVRETFAWRHFYWYLTDDGVAHLRRFLHLPPKIVPLSLQRHRRATPAPPHRPPADTGTGRGRPAAGGDRLYRRKAEGERHPEPLAGPGWSLGGVGAEYGTPGGGQGAAGDPRCCWGCHCCRTLPRGGRGLRCGGIVLMGGVFTVG
uniref:Plectin/eS10 N-terminal domain-containing protein n=1 Tax=Calidris pygmaea TaxID=425635 RepID=A0A8C3J6D9_9CHAR